MTPSVQRNRRGNPFPRPLRAGEFCECIGTTPLGAEDFDWTICKFVGGTVNPHTPIPPGAVWR